MAASSAPAAPQTVRIMAWNLGHQTRATEPSDDVLRAIGLLSPDVLVLTEAVPLGDGLRLFSRLASLGLSSVLITPRTKRQNQVVIAARTELQPGYRVGPTFTPATAPNFLHVVAPGLGIEVIGIRVPMFNGHPGAERAYWDWFESTSPGWQKEPTVVIGDLNADPRKPKTIGGGSLARLRDAGWQMSDPAEPWSFVSGSRLDHALVGPGLTIEDASFVVQREDLCLAGPSVPRLSDHAALLVTINVARPGASA